MNALVLDDEQRYRDHLKRCLERKGRRIHVARRAEEAKNIVREFGADLMIVDIKLADDLDGLEFANGAKS
ncbi:MAG: response regulator [Phycisphaerae bacterium]